MFRIASFKSAFANVKRYAFTHCDEKEDEDDHYDDDSNTPSFVEEVSLKNYVNVQGRAFDNIESFSDGTGRSRN